MAPQITAWFVCLFCVEEWTLQANVQGRTKKTKNVSPGKKKRRLMKAEEERGRHYGRTKQCHGVTDAAGFEVSLSADRYGVGSESRGYVCLLLSVCALLCWACSREKKNERPLHWRGWVWMAAKGEAIQLPAFCIQMCLFAELASIYSVDVGKLCYRNPCYERSLSIYKSMVNVLQFANNFAVL